MNAFSSYEELLDQPCDPNGWSDDGVLLAAERLRTFDAEAWDSLRGTWPVKSENWQFHCADSLSDGDPHYSIPILLDMIRSCTDRVRTIACDALRVVMQARSVPLEIDKDLFQIICRLGQASSGLSAKSIQQLLSRLAVT